MNRGHGLVCLVSSEASVADPL